MSGPRLTRRLLLRSAATACGFAGAPRQAPVKPQAAAVTAETIGGETFVASALSVSGRTISLDGRTWDWGELIDVVVPGPVEPAGQRGWIELTGGDRPFGEATDCDGETVDVRLAGNISLSIPAERVRGVRFTGGGTPTKPQRLAILRARGPRDWALLRVGGRIGGELNGFDATAVRLQTALGERAVPRAEVRAVAFTPELQRPAERPARTLAVLLADGSHLTAASLNYGPGGGEAQTTAGVVVPIAAGAVRGLTPFAPALRDAGEPKVTFGPGSIGEPAPARDRTATGRRALADGRPRPRGWGVWSGTTLTFAAPPGATTFLAAFAVDARAGAPAECDARASVDGAVRWERARVRAGALRPLRLPLAGAKAVSLHVAPGVLGGVRDEAFWVAPRFAVRRE